MPSLRTLRRTREQYCGTEAESTARDVVQQGYGTDAERRGGDLSTHRALARLGVLREGSHTLDLRHRTNEEEDSASDAYPRRPARAHGAAPESTDAWPPWRDTLEASRPRQLGRARGVARSCAARFLPLACRSPQCFLPSARAKRCALPLITRRRLPHHRSH